MTNKIKIPFIWSEYENFSGLDANIIYKRVEGNSNGANLAGLVNYIEGNSNGVNLAVVGNNIEGNSNGANFAIGGNDIGGDSKGVNLAGLVNYSKGVKDFLIQYATLGNVIKEKNKDAFVLNIGLYNKIEDYFCPFVQVYGLKNLPKILKESFSKKKANGLEEKLEGEGK